MLGGVLGGVLGAVHRGVLLAPVNPGRGAGWVLAVQMLAEDPNRVPSLLQVGREVPVGIHGGTRLVLGCSTRLVLGCSTRLVLGWGTRVGH